MTEDPAAFIVVMRRKIQELNEILDRFEKGVAVQKSKTHPEMLKHFPEDLRKMLVFTEETDKWVIRFKAYVDKWTFARVARIVVDQIGGTYISAGKDSRFEIPKP